MAKSAKVMLTLTEKEKEYLTDGYRRYVSLSTGEILTMNRWILAKVIEAIENEAE